MTQPDVNFNHDGNGSASQVPIAIDPHSFFQYASSGKDRWDELVGLTINHCTFGRGTIKKIDGDYIYVDLPERQGKHLTEFGLDSFQKGFFNNLQIDDALQQKIVTAAAVSLELAAQAEILEAATPKESAKKKKKVTKTTNTKTTKKVKK